MANCVITKPLRKEMLPLFAVLILFLKAVIGLKPDNTNAGYKPANKVTTIARAN